MATALLDGFCKQAANLSLSGIVVRQNGKEIARHHWEKETRRTQYSASKTFTSAAVGMAVAEGLFSLTDPVADFFSDELPPNPDLMLKQLTVRDLLVMAVGQDQPYLLGETRKAVEGSWPRFALSRPFVCSPGTRFQYTNVGAYLAGVILQRLTGGTLVDFLMPRLFEPLGMERPFWESDPEGYTFGAAGLEITVGELSRFGQVYLDGGRWKGRELIPSGWVAESSKSHIETLGFADDLTDNRYGYGYQIWRGRHNTYRADGVYGQYCIMIPDRDAVVAVNANEPDRQLILDAVWAEILPRL